MLAPFETQIIPKDGNFAQYLKDVENIARYSAIEFLLTREAAVNVVESVHGLTSITLSTWQCMATTWELQIEQRVLPTFLGSHRSPSSSSFSDPASVHIVSARLCSSDKARLLARAGKDQNLRDALFLLLPTASSAYCPLSQQVSSRA